MSEEEVEIQTEDQGSESKKSSRWRIVLVSMAVLSLIMGFSMKAEPRVAPQTVEGTSVEGILSSNGLVAGDQDPKVWDENEFAQEEEESILSSYSPFFIKGGFSFLVAFCVGMAVRMFFKVTALFVGVLALSLFGLNYLGWVDVDWQVMSDHWDNFSGKIADQADGFRSFVTGSLPAAGAGALGLFTGFKRG